MRILHAAAELYPIVRTGGLGDVLAALPPAQSALGHDVRLVLPGYPAVLAALEDAEVAASPGPMLGADRVTLWRGMLPPVGLTTYVIDAPALFDRPGNPYLGPDGLDWPDNAARFGLLGWMAAELARGAADPAWRADVLHGHDWHAGLAPAYLALAVGPAPRPVSVFTVHNLAFQGLFPPATLTPLGLPAGTFQIDGLEFWGQLSFMKAGLVYADRITTVSPSYAREIATAEYGCGLEGVIQGRGADVSGILNGVDPAHWDPRHDPHLAAPFDARRLSVRRTNKAALLARFGLEPGPGPLYGAVSRLTAQKGLDLVLDALPALLSTGGSLVLLGSGDADLEAGFVAAAGANPTRIAVTLGYDDALSHGIIGGSDVVLVPSRFEPCGLTQLYALCYGAVPLVRRTGGLADTVVDATDAALADGTATGIVFDPATGPAVAAALGRAAALFERPAVWRRLQQAGMRRRFGWDDAAAAYLSLYRGVTSAI